MNRFFFIEKKDTVFLHRFSSWRGVSKGGEFKPILTINGRIRWSKDKVLFYPKGNNKEITYFDFGLPIGRADSITYNFEYEDLLGEKKIGTKAYFLKKISATPCSEKKDTVYGFKFEGFGLNRSDTDLYLAITKRKGVLAIYEILKKRHRSCIYSQVGEVDKFRYIIADSTINNCGDIF